MPLRFSTGRESRVKHSTGAEPDQVAKARRGYPRPRYSTGESTSIAHFTGRETDYRALAEDSDIPVEHIESPPATARGR